MTPGRALAGVASLIALLDLLQVVFLGKGIGAVGGALIYGVVAAGALRGWRPAIGIAVIIPSIPIAVFSGALGQETREALVDTGMLVVFVLQLAAAGLGVVVLWRSRAGEPGEMR